ncbi:hypothetical protein ONS95_008376 [Cadophora gregata]|uniref:uncharacterized protein n=1 Tax=Cadophora gregata TaxID=51156 RepID=UPI0026DC5F00|nr:uncharacterized protein ONS95_008376 [Cadophora gregata]KAK0126796.1 hypothetical protein ONS95_008376 [Cadophora gregata]
MFNKIPPPRPTLGCTTLTAAHPSRPSNRGTPPPLPRSNDRSLTGKTPRSHIAAASSTLVPKILSLSLSLSLSQVVFPCRRQSCEGGEVNLSHLANTTKKRVPDLI